MRRHDVRFLAFMAVFGGLVFAVYREEVLGPPLEPLALLTAEVTLALLHWAGMEAVRTATVVAHPGGFAYEVAYTCIGFLPIVFYAAAVLCYPVELIKRVLGVAAGVPLLLTLNFGRLVHLFHLGVHDRTAFDWWHEDVWPGIIRLTIIGLWIVWVCWAKRRSGDRRGRVVINLLRFADRLLPSRGTAAARFSPASSQNREYMTEMRVEGGSMYHSRGNEVKKEDTEAIIPNCPRICG